MVATSKLKTWHLNNKIIFLRADLNVPLENGHIVDDFRLRMLRPTIDHIIKHGGSIILATHIGRPTERDATLSTHLLLPWFKKHGYDIGFKTDLNKSQPKYAITLLENLRFFHGEKKNNPEFAKKLAHLADYYVNDAFGVMHRNDTSITLVPKFFPPEKRSIGLLVEKELRMLNQLIENPIQPFVAILGGSKIADKILPIQGLLEKTSAILLCPAIVFSFLKSLDKTIGKSIVDENSLILCKKIIEHAKQKNVTLHFPVDYQVAQESFDGPLSMVDAENIQKNDLGISIGPKTQQMFKKTIKSANTLFFNGAIGFANRPETIDGMKALMQAMAQSDGLSIIAGGDSVAAVNNFSIADQIDHLSTGGGAALAVVSGKILPGLEILLTNKVTRSTEWYG